MKKKDKRLQELNNENNKLHLETKELKNLAEIKGK